MTHIKKKLHSFISKKLLVMAVATHAMYYGVLTDEHWILVASVYLGAEAYLTRTSIKENNDQSSI